jgi:hypothetical protein
MPLQPDKTEDSNQILLVNHIRRTYPDLAPYWHHSPAGGSRSPREAQKFKMMGVARGIPDLLCMASCGPYVGAAIELKLLKGRLSPDQKLWLERLESQGWYAKVAYGYEESKFFVDEYCQLS